MSICYYPCNVCCSCLVPLDVTLICPCYTLDTADTTPLIAESSVSYSYKPVSWSIKLSGERHRHATQVSVLTTKHTGEDRALYVVHAIQHF